MIGHAPIVTIEISMSLIVKNGFDGHIEGNNYRKDTHELSRLFGTIYVQYRMA